MRAALNNAVAFDTALLERNSRLRTARMLLPLRSDEDVVALRKHVRERAVAIALSLVDQTKLVTASASAWAVPGAWSTSSTSIPVREKARQCLSLNGNADQFAVTAACIPD
jgi:hypothetical protein